MFETGLVISGSTGVEDPKAWNTRDGLPRERGSHVIKGTPA